MNAFEEVWQRIAALVSCKAQQYIIPSTTRIPHYKTIFEKHENESAGCPVEANDLIRPVYFSQL